MSEGFDVAQICNNGHEVNSTYNNMPEFRQEHCEQCGAKSVTACQHCKKSIRGKYWGTMSLAKYEIPKYCGECGTAFPWTTARMEAIRELVEMAPGLSEADKQLVNEALPDIAKSTPRTEVAILKMRKALSKSKDFGKKIFEKVATDIATDQAKLLLLESIKSWSL